MMKKFMMIVAGCFLAVNSLMAAYQYGDFIGVDNWTQSLYALSDSNLTLNFVSNISNWNTLTVQATDTLGNVTTNTVEITGQSVNIGDVKTGDNLKFFLTSNSSAHGTADINWTAWGSGWDVAEWTYEYLHFGANYGKWGSRYVATTFTVDGSAAPTGQPLPGALAALLVGGAGAGAFAIRRKKTASAK